MHRVLNYVAESRKFEVHVLCIRYAGEEREEKVGNVNVHRFNPPLWGRMRNGFQKTQKYKSLARICEIITKSVTIPTFPNTEPLTTRYYCIAARKLQQEFGFDLVMSEHHGLSTLLTGCQLKKEFPELKHIPILWDPIKGQIATKKLPPSFTDRRISEVESFVSQYSTLQISTISMKAYFKEHGDKYTNHRLYLDIPSVLQPEEEVRTDFLNLLNRDAINIVYSGLLSKYYRDARPIIRLFDQCEFAEHINFVLFSKGEKEEVEAEAKNFKGKIVYHDYIPLTDLHTIYRHSDFLLNISHINEKMIPSKIFEYMSYGKPIISTFVTEGDAAKNYIDRYPEGVCVDLKESIVRNISLLNTFIGRKHEQVPFSQVKDLFRENTPEMYLKVIEQVLNDND